jgi:hypothetical protein
MKKITLIVALVSFAVGQGQTTFPPAAGIDGSTAISKDSPDFVAWATGIAVTRGHVKKSDPSFMYQGSSYATVGEPENALGSPNLDIVSLGDEGSAILTFASPINDGEGFDFAVFENGSSNFLELAFVEASSDGVHFFRFPATSLTQTDTQIGSFGSPIPTNLNNLAGKYTALFGTPFDISELPNDVLLNKNNITHIKVIDVVGSIDPLYATYDSLGHMVNESYPTPFNSAGFDLQAVGVIHQSVLGIDNPESIQKVTLYPNPAKGRVFINGVIGATINIVDASGRIVLQQLRNTAEGIDVSALSSGVYLTVINSENGNTTLRLVIQ